MKLTIKLTIHETVVKGKGKIGRDKKNSFEIK